MLHAALSAITAHAPVLRVKGFAHVRDAGRASAGTGGQNAYYLYHGTGHTAALRAPPERAHQHSHTPTPPHAHQAMAELVFIGYHLERHLIVADLCEHTGTTWY